MSTNPTDTQTPSSVTAQQLSLDGHVQGVGFRPFVYRLALQLGLVGWVENRVGTVVIQIQGPAAHLSRFERAVIDEAPPLAEPRLLDSHPVETEGLDEFVIRDSRDDGEIRIRVPADSAVCEQCLGEMFDPDDRRYRYPFINCTQCGPRYTLIRALPYDRPNTSMAAFPLCDDCRGEYEEPSDRRFHAEPVACAQCGPRLSFVRPHSNATLYGEDALAACIASLRQGEIVAVKGIGGYHLMCDAGNPEAIQALRERKPRPDKPLAIMLPEQGEDGLAAIERELSLSEAQRELLRSPMRPIVLAPRRDTSTLPWSLAPGLAEIGVMLPYSPLHHLLLAGMGGPLVATSANISGEPVLTDNLQVERRLGHVADAYLHHDRPIVRPTDDPVFRDTGRGPLPIRLGRGCAPLELELTSHLAEPVLAVGGHMKNTIALAWQDRVVISPHIGDMGTPRSEQVFRQVIEDLQRLYQVQARRILCDAHPGYASSRWARNSGLPVTPILHHHAHASALYEEHRGEGHWLVFAWDGVGMGEDGSLWGGEGLLGRPGHWRRVSSLRPFNPPGGDKAGREPWRSAAAICWALDMDWMPSGIDASLARRAWQQGINSPTTSAAGRLFDAASALLGICELGSFEGQGPMWLESLADTDAKGPHLELTQDDAGLWRADWSLLPAYLLDRERSVSERAGGFHWGLARSLVDQVLTMAKDHPVKTVGLCGGVFQNALLSRMVVRLLRGEGFEVHLGGRVPVNDAGLSYGQVADFEGQNL